MELGIHEGNTFWILHSYDLWVHNTRFKRDSHPVTIRTRVNATKIDYFLTRMIDRGSWLNCKFLPRKCVAI